MKVKVAVGLLTFYLAAGVCAGKLSALAGSSNLCDLFVHPKSVCNSHFSFPQISNSIHSRARSLWLALAASLLRARACSLSRSRSLSLGLATNLRARNTPSHHAIPLRLPQFRYISQTAGEQFAMDHIFPRFTQRQRQLWRDFFVPNLPIAFRCEVDAGYGWKRSEQASS